MLRSLSSREGWTPCCLLRVEELLISSRSARWFELDNSNVFVMWRSNFYNSRGERCTLASFVVVPSSWITIKKIPGKTIQYFGEFWDFGAVFWSNTNIGGGPGPRGGFWKSGSPGLLVQWSLAQNGFWPNFWVSRFPNFWISKIYLSRTHFWEPKIYVP